MHGYLVTSADCDETAPEGEPSSTAELLRQCAALLLFGSEKTEMLEFSPDFYELNGGAKVEQMRMIRQELSKKAFGGNNRVVVITDAHMMNDSAVNAMLKMLEEPPEGTFFLLTGIEQRILPTIRSRCQIVRLGTASAAEIGAEALLLAKNTDYVYTADPKVDPNAQSIPEIGYVEVIDRGLSVMDNSALTLCMDNRIPILVFGLKAENSIRRVACGERIGTIIH